MGGEARALVSGRGGGPALVAGEPLSFWGGIDIPSGRIIDPHHPRFGATVAGRVLVMPCGRGSSSSSSVLAECIRVNTSPAAILLEEPDPILAIGAVVGRELYGRTIPIVVWNGDGIAEGVEVEVHGDRVTIRTAP